MTLTMTIILALAIYLIGVGVSAYIYGRATPHEDRWEVAAWLWPLIAILILSMPIGLVLWMPNVLHRLGQRHATAAKESKRQ